VYDHGSLLMRVIDLTHAGRGDHRSLTAER